jgi:hypothetical protein
VKILIDIDKKNSIVFTTVMNHSTGRIMVNSLRRGGESNEDHIW